jgi:hypothetical protein
VLRDPDGFFVELQQPDPLPASAANTIGRYSWCCWCSFHRGFGEDRRILARRDWVQRAADGRR